MNIPLRQYGYDSKSIGKPTYSAQTLHIYTVNMVRDQLLRHIRSPKSMSAHPCTPQLFLGRTIPCSSAPVYYGRTQTIVILSIVLPIAITSTLELRLTVSQYCV